MNVIIMIVIILISLGGITLSNYQLRYFLNIKDRRNNWE